ncbi:MAG: D-alanyl-D-alanine carboxypeptidase family protein [Janthinobacterium lividum]
MKKIFSSFSLLVKLCLVTGLFATIAYAKPKPIKNVPASTPIAVVNAPTSTTNGPNLNAKQAILIDVPTGEILLEKNADEIMPPSSMSKIMTTYLIFEELKTKRLQLSTTFPVSEKAWRKQGSKMFLTLNDQVSVEDLLRGIIIQSGNDACITIAEGLSGSEETFAQQMTQVAKDLGAKNSNFVNSTGWPDENHYSTARDLAIIAQKLIENYPLYYPFFAEREFTYHKIHQMNRNPLLAAFPGADGLKTGSTDAGGFGLVGTAIQDGRRLIMVINGADSKKSRAVDSKALLQWGFSNFPCLQLYKKNDIVGQADIWLGAKSQVNLIVKEAVNIIVPRQDIKNTKITLVYKGPLAAPLKANQEVGHIIVARPQKPDLIIPVMVQEDVAKAGPLFSLKAAFLYLFKGHH